MQQNSTKGFKGPAIKRKSLKGALSHLSALSHADFVHVVSLDAAVGFFKRTAPT
jgi:hypothetical protein